jgi:hypothetical protein
MLLSLVLLDVVVDVVVDIIPVVTILLLDKDCICDCTFCCCCCCDDDDDDDVIQILLWNAVLGLTKFIVKAMKNNDNNTIITVVRGCKISNCLVIG